MSHRQIVKSSPRVANYELDEYIQYVDQYLLRIGEIIHLENSWNRLCIHFYVKIGSLWPALSTGQS